MCLQLFINICMMLMIMTLEPVEMTLEVAVTMGVVTGNDEGFDSVTSSSS